MVITYAEKHIQVKNACLSWLEDITKSMVDKNNYIEIVEIKNISGEEAELIKKAIIEKSSIRDALRKIDIGIKGYHIKQCQMMSEEGRTHTEVTILNENYSVANEKHYEVLKKASF